MIRNIFGNIKKFVFCSDCLEESEEIEILRKMVLDWEQTAKMLAMDLGNIELATEIYEDVASSLYDKVRSRLNIDK